MVITCALVKIVPSRPTTKPEPRPELVPDRMPELEPEPELPVAAIKHLLEPEAGPAPEVATAACVGFASTPRGYRLVELGDGPVPDVGEHVEVSDVGELVVLRRGPSPLPSDERVCVFLEQLAPAAHVL